MRDIIRLLFSDGEPGGEHGGWDEPRRRARVEDSREWCGTQPGEDALGQLAAVLRGGSRRRGPRGIVVRRGRW
jgi:hypothetical protein